MRSEFAGTVDGTYLDAASLGPLPRAARTAIDNFNSKRARVQEMRAGDFAGPVDAAREACAALISAHTDEIALVPNTSYGINVAARGLQVPPGSTILTSDREFPANVYPWLGRRDLRLERVPVDHRGWPDEDRIARRLGDGDVSVLTLSSVQFSNGYRADLERLGEICRQRGIVFVVDAIQSLGQIPLDVSNLPIDIVAAGAHKWLCGPMGTGFLFVRRDIQDRLDPTFIGWNSMEACQRLDFLLGYDWKFLPDARRYEQGTAPLQDLAGLAASIRLLLGVGIDRIESYLDRLLDPLRRWLQETPEISNASPVDAGRRSAIVSLRTTRPETAFRALRTAGVYCSFREGSIRFAAHLYNTPADIERVIEVLRKCRESHL